jgi:tight adherence protein B
VKAGDVRVLENGKPVSDLRLVQAGAAERRAFGVVLAIDSSESMHNGAISSAMDAARAFAARRPERQSLGVMFFDHDAAIALPLTNDAARINETLGADPPLSKGTRLNDAVASAVRMLHEADVAAGSVVVLSDGADVGSHLTTSAVGEAARRSHVRIFSVGLRSRSFDASTLRALALEGSGSYGEAGSADELTAVFDDIAQRLAGEYLLSYTSLAKVNARVRVQATVSGIQGTATAEYKAPPLAVAPVHAARAASWWTSTAALVLSVVLVALMLGFALYLALRPTKLSVTDRIDAFVTPAGGRGAVTLTDRQAASLLAGVAERSLGRTRYWSKLVLDLDVARITVAPVVVALAILTSALFAFWLFAIVLGQAFLGFLFLLGIPIGVRRYVSWKAGKERRTFADELVDNLQVIVSAMRAGYSFAGALAVAVEDAAEPARTELRRIVRDEQLGVPLEDAVNEVARRMESRELEHVGLVAALQRETGGNTAEVLDRLIDSVRGRTEIRLLVRTLTAQGRFGGGIVSALPVAVAVVMNVINPGYLDPLTHSFGGVLALVAAGTGILAGWLLIRRIVDIKV